MTPHSDNLALLLLFFARAAVLIFGCFALYAAIKQKQVFRSVVLFGILCCYAVLVSLPSEANRTTLIRTAINTFYALLMLSLSKFENPRR